MDMNFVQGRSEAGYAACARLERAWGCLEQILTWLISLGARLNFQMGLTRCSKV